MFRDLIGVFLEGTESKLVSSMIPVIVGSGLLTWLLKVRDRQMAIRDESLKFINDVAERFIRPFRHYFDVCAPTAMAWGRPGTARMNSSLIG